MPSSQEGGVDRLDNIERYVERIADAIWPVDNLSSEEAIEELRRDVRKGLELSGLAADYRGAVGALHEIKRVAAIEAPPVSDGVPAKVWKIAYDALERLRGR